MSFILNRPITIATFYDAQEGMLVKALLEANGFTCYTMDEYTVQNYSKLYSLPFGGVKIQVDEEDVEAAVQWLQENGYMKDDEETESSFEKKVNTALNTASKKWTGEKIITTTFWFLIGLLVVFILFIT